MNANLEAIKQEIIAGAEELNSAKEVYEFRKKFLDGKTGKIGLLMREMKNIPNEEKAAYGKGVNELKEWFDAHKSELPPTMQINSSAFTPDLSETVNMLFEQAYICYENPKMQGCIWLLKKIKENLVK